jgi:hypothetical protein
MIAIGPASQARMRRTMWEQHPVRKDVSNLNTMPKHEVQHFMRR